TGEPAGPVLEHEAPPRLLGFDPSGAKLFTAVPPTGDFAATGAESVYAWDIASGKLLYEPIHATKERLIRNVLTAADGRYLVLNTSSDATSRESEVHVRDALSGKEVGQTIRINAPFFAALVSPEGDRIVVSTQLGVEDQNPAGKTGEWRLWDLTTGDALTPAG